MGPLLTFSRSPKFVFIHSDIIQRIRTAGEFLFPVSHSQYWIVCYVAKKSSVLRPMSFVRVGLFLILLIFVE